MDFSFIEPAFKTAFGNVSVTRTETDFIFKSKLDKDSCFSLKLSLDFRKLERSYETKDAAYSFKSFFSKDLEKTSSNETLGSIIVTIVQNLSKVSEWGCSKDIDNLPINRTEFIVGEFSRLEALYGRKNYLIIEGNETIRHYPEGCGLALQIKQVGDAESTYVMTKSFEWNFGGGTLKLLKIIGWWFHNCGESLEDWLKSSSEDCRVFGIEAQACPSVRQLPSMEGCLSLLPIISYSFIGTEHESYMKLIENKIKHASGHGERSTAVAMTPDDPVAGMLTRCGYQVTPTNFPSICTISW